jgi:hypothetical protein
MCGECLPYAAEVVEAVIAERLEQTVALRKSDQNSSIDGGLNWSTQHFNLLERWSVLDEVSSGFTIQLSSVLRSDRWRGESMS